MEPLDDDLPEPGFKHDWNFIVLAHGSTIYDIAAGILYEFRAAMTHDQNDAVFAERAGTNDPKILIEGPLARDFWRQFQERVNF